MSSRRRPNSDSWNKHEWRRDTTWWDDLEVDPTLIKDAYPDVFDWLEEVAPDPYEHDYILYTDGSGCDVGWGGYAAVWERIEKTEEIREPVETGALVSGTYGSTVQRSEFNAFLDGVHSILTARCREIKDQAQRTEDGLALYEMGTQGVLSQLSGPDRLTILWYTDRNNLAKSFLHDESGSPLCSRDKERDLWLRWSFMARHVCITPMCRPRNVVDGQAVCDELAGVARSLLKGAEATLAEAAEKIHTQESWKRKQPQTALF